MVKKNKILFYSSVTNLNLFKITGFYYYDIIALELSGYHVTTTNTYKDFFKFWTYDISFLYFYKKSLIPGLISLFLNKKIIYTGGIDEISNEVNIKMVSRCIYKALFVLNYIISHHCNIVSTKDLENTKKLLVSFGFKKCKKLIYFPHAIDTNNILFQNISNKENIFTTICWMGNAENVKRKGVDKAIEIFKIFLTFNKDFKLFIIGTIGDGTNYLQNIINKHDLNNNVFFTDSITEIEKIKILQKSLFYFQISKYEGFGLAVLEAMICNNFIIHSGKGGLIDTIGDNGLKVESKDSYINVANSIHNIYQNYSIFSNEIENNKNYIFQKFDLKDRSMNFNKIIQKNEL